MNEAGPAAPDFVYRDGALHAEGVALAHLADEIGTPVYVYSAAHLERQFQRFAASLAGRDALISYSVKANDNQAVIATLARLGAGADVVSEGEFRRALAAGVPGRKIVFSGVGKSARELEFALAHDVHQINVESPSELALVSAIAQRLGCSAPIAIRANPDVDARTHTKIATGRREDKFGVELAQTAALYRHAMTLPGIAPVGLAVHIGSQITTLAPFETAFTRTIELLRALRAEGIDLTRLDLGGGLGIRYRDETPPAVEDYCGMVKRLTDNLGVSLAVEPGRVIVGNAGVLVARVLVVKEGLTKKFIVLDAAMNDLIRPALYEAWHEILPVAAPAPGAARQSVDIVGPVCETGDSFAAGRALPPVKEGDLLAILSAGAYGASMSSRYNARLPAPEVLVRGSAYAVIRPRPSYESDLALDRLPPWLAER